MTDKPSFTDQFIDLAQPRLGAVVIRASDDFFAAKERLIKPGPPVFMADKYDDHGKWMDGWESRRKRDSGNDYCIVQLCAGTIRGFDINTTFFTGNFPPQASIDGCCEQAQPGPNTVWESLLDVVDLQGDAHHYFEIQDQRVWTHVRLNIFPDGGIARLRVYGEAHRDWTDHAVDEWVDLAAMENGGRALACNDMHYGHMCNLIAPGKAANMGDGWETRRRREAGYDWVLLKLGHSGSIRKIELDTMFFKGNYPDSCSLMGAYLSESSDADIDIDAPYWQQILPQMKLGPDQLHQFIKNVTDVGPVTHVLLKIFPDGGISRLRLLGPVFRK